MGELHLDVYAQRIGNKHALEIYNQSSLNNSYNVLDHTLYKFLKMIHHHHKLCNDFFNIMN